MQNFQDNVFQRLDNHSSSVHRRTPVEMYQSSSIANLSIDHFRLYITSRS